MIRPRRLAPQTTLPRPSTAQAPDSCHLFPMTVAGPSPSKSEPTTPAPFPVDIFAGATPAVAPGFHAPLLCSDPATLAPNHPFSLNPATVLVGFSTYHTLPTPRPHAAYTALSSSMTIPTFHAPPSRLTHFCVAAADECDTARQLMSLGKRVAMARSWRNVFCATAGGHACQ